MFKAAQPALLYLVPFTLIPLFGMAWMKVRFLIDHHIHIQRKHNQVISHSQGDLRSMWSDPFVHVPPAKYQAI